MSIADGPIPIWFFLFIILRGRLGDKNRFPNQGTTGIRKFLQGYAPRIINYHNFKIIPIRRGRYHNLVDILIVGT
jgi:hypothetical protein